MDGNTTTPDVVTAGRIVTGANPRPFRIFTVESSGYARGWNLISVIGLTPNLAASRLNVASL